MVSSLNSKLCNTLGDLLNRCTSKFINSSQIYPQLDHSIYDYMCNDEEWSEVIHNLRELPGGSYMKFSTCLSLFVCIPWLLVTGGLNLLGASPMHFISKYMPGGFLSRTLVFFVVAHFWWWNDIDILQGEKMMSFYFWQPNLVQKWEIHSIDILIRKLIHPCRSKHSQSCSSFSLNNESFGFQIILVYFQIWVIIDLTLSGLEI